MGFAKSSGKVSLVVDRVIVQYGPLSMEWKRPVSVLFLSEEDLHRTSEEVEVCAELVLQESLVRIADILRQVAEEREGRRSGRELCDVLDLDVLSLPCWRRIVLDFRKHHLVDLRSRDLARVVLVYM